MSRLRSLPLLLAGLAVVATGCGSDTSADGAAEVSAPATPAPLDPSDPTFVGRVDGTEAFVAIVPKGDAARIYLCDSDQISEWLAGTTSGDELSASKDGFSVTGTVDDEIIDGDVTLPDGSSHPFSAELAAEDSAAGLYRGEVVEDGTTTSSGGFIVLPDESIRGYVEPENLAVPKTLISVLTGRRSLAVPGGGTLRITDGTSNITDGTSN